MKSPSRLISSSMMALLFVSYGFTAEGGTEAANPAGVAASPASGAAGAPKNLNSRWGTDKEQVQRRLSTLDTLVEKSSGAKNVAASGIAEAISMRDQARAKRDQARSLLDAGDLKGASERTGEGTALMFEAIRKADGGATHASKNVQDFERRMKSVESLTDALDRVRKEKKAGEESNKISEQVHQMTGEAKALFNKGEVDKGRAILDKAYVTAKVGIEQLRRGDTLVRSLNFASKEEEYHYEVDRNDTHQMLIGMLLNKDGSSPDPRIKQFITNAAELRRQADQQGKAGKFAEAIKTLEDSTMELIKAIRGSGIYIPG
ncbi:MAG: hypothetical protein HQL84_11885 [Magnetococcales bacterium]|nr:hypothetical protein [Magnetococcales bacterium]MBF0150735.1 hypothetical protein [Magnetococcales bacterium]MBF0346036.1 hypothetical protein [Magnetococcales bacterium]MBF0631825.1 hypothetical protein [Magnetococcales bacterium]